MTHYHLTRTIENGHVVSTVTVVELGEEDEVAKVLQEVPTDPWIISEGSAILEYEATLEEIQAIIDRYNNAAAEREQQTALRAYADPLPVGRKWLTGLAEEIGGVETRLREIQGRLAKVLPNTAIDSELRRLLAIKYRIEAALAGEETE